MNYSYLESMEKSAASVLQARERDRKLQEIEPRWRDLIWSLENAERSLRHMAGELASDGYTSISKIYLDEADGLKAAADKAIGV